MLWNVAEPTVVDDELRRLHGTCQACHAHRTETLLDASVGITDVRSVAADVRDAGGDPAGRCLQKSTEITGKLHRRGVPATVRTAPFGFDERLHYVCLFNGAFVAGVDDRLYAVDATLTQFEGEPTCSGQPAEDIPEVVIVPKGSDVAERWYASMNPPTG